MDDMNGNKIVSGMIWRFGEKITAQLVSFAVSIVLARLLMPDDYGIVAIVNVFIAIAEIFVTSGFGTSLIQKKDADDIDFSSVFWCNLIFSIMLYMALFFFASIIANFYNMPLIAPVLRVFGLRLPIAAINSIQNAYVSRNMDFKKFFWATLIGTIVSAALGITMAYMGFGVWALIAQYLSNSIIDTIVLFIIIKWRPLFVFSAERVKPLISYGWKILATDLIGTIFNQLNSFIIGKKYSSIDLAYYTQGKKMPDLINSNIGSTLSAVLFPAMSMSGDKEQIKKIRRKSLKIMEYIMFPMMFGLGAVADNIIILLMTDKWIEAVPYVRITCLAAIFGVLGTTLIQEVKAIGRSDVTLKMELIKKPIILVIAIVAMKLGVKAIAWTLVINEIVIFMFNVYPVKKYIGFDVKTYLKDAVPPFIMSAVMAMIVYMIGLLINNHLVCLVIQVIVGGLIYIISSIVTRNESYIYLKKMLINKMNN